MDTATILKEALRRCEARATRITELEKALVAAEKAIADLESRLVQLQNEQFSSSTSFSDDDWECLE